MMPNNLGPFRPAVFDCDVLLDPDRGVRPTGAGSTGSLASHGIVGYLRLRQDPNPPILAEAVALLKQVQALGAPAAAGPVAAEAQVAGTGFNFSLTAVEVQSMTAVAGHPENLAVALRGTPHLPRDGAWSVSRRGATEPKPVDPLLPVPLVRRLADKATWHIMEPGELNYVAAGQDPPTQYGLLQSTGRKRCCWSIPSSSMARLCR
jgi:hypothetical protein